mmetsp:Transcript_112834/g.319172  ORF Transcript_112834/g.319172 Transcript_112834/m.319172 type:complete len:160 (+) Transcript_112834:41-520(+)|eukprot:CAMPEP_0168362582 /NCGR_PEP_ID=MMETSP0228-20121227/3252_1 /TAXON_ID=133427 /ORGANISM="Protoceratium reticulatum, Strain CCCM 535 (=CCMP 1889)" /LENGTH=159 /DNA_ID=CAMNT_0008375287 /DNA_START=34 /DNA_END=513 /DNA_ORIENTATION=+
MAAMRSLSRMHTSWSPRHGQSGMHHPVPLLAIALVTVVAGTMSWVRLQEPSAATGFVKPPPAARRGRARPGMDSVSRKCRGEDGPRPSNPPAATDTGISGVEDKRRLLEFVSNMASLVFWVLFIRMVVMEHYFFAPQRELEQAVVQGLGGAIVPLLPTP